MRTRVTERNMFAIMGKINKFLQKDTRRYVGIKTHKVGVRMEKFGNEEYPVPILEEKETYLPFIGGCHEHWIRRDIREKMKKGDRIFKDDMRQYHEVLLAVYDCHEMECIPIKAGFTVEITGDRMTIRENDVVYKNNIAGEHVCIRNKERSSYQNFYHMEIPEEEKREETRKSLYSTLSSVYDSVLMEDFYEEFPSYIADTLRERSDDFYRIISSQIENLDIRKNIDIENFEFNGFNVKVIYYIEKASIKAKDGNIKFIIDENEYLDILDLIMTMSSKEMEEMTEEEEEDLPIW